VIDASEETSVPAPSSPRRRSSRASAASRTNAPAQPRRDLDEDFSSPYPSSSQASDPYEEDFYGSARRPTQTSFRFRLRRNQLRIPKTLWGRILTGVSLAVVLTCLILGLLAIRSFFLHDPRFTLQSASSVQITGNAHLSRSQILTVFGEDIERNIFLVSLADRRASLEQLPWIERATVMRLLPDRLRIEITERTPVAFVRQGTQIGLVDAGGVLLDMPPNAPGDPSYSFPVITGISATDPVSTRAARMKLYRAFAQDLDSTGEKISEKLSEVDLSNPEDVKALIPEGPTDILVHFGDSDFLSRYQKFEQHLPEWRNQYPHLASVDMRYERQVVLEMQPGAPPVNTADGNTKTDPKADSKNPAAKASAPASTKPVAKTPAKPLKGKAAAKPAQKGKSARPIAWAPVPPPSHSGAAPAHTSSTGTTQKTPGKPASPAPQAAQQ
jgi:cell division protein FtsQ